MEMETGTLAWEDCKNLLKIPKFLIIMKVARFIPRRWTHDHETEGGT